MLDSMKNTYDRQKLDHLWMHSILILNFGLVSVYLIAWGMAWKQNLFWRADFSSFYTGWKIVLDGRGDDLYDFDLQTRYQQAILEGRSFKDGLLPFINPPGLPLLFTPLAKLPVSSAFLVWTCVQLALLAWLMALLARFSAHWTPIERWLLAGAVLAFPPLLHSFLLGAFSLLILVCILQFTLDLKRGLQDRSALWFLIGTVKPQNMVLLGAMLGGSRRWRTLAWVSLGGAAMFIGSSLIFGWRIWPMYIKQLSSVSGFFGKYGIYPDLMYNFKGALTTLFGSGNGALINQISLLALGISSVSVFLLWLGPFHPDLPEFELRMAFTLVLAWFFNIHLHPQDGLLYVAPAILFYDYLRQKGLPRRIYSVFILLCPVLFLFFEFILKDSLRLQGQVVVAFILALWIGKAWFGDSGSGKFLARKGCS